MSIFDVLSLVPSKLIMWSEVVPPLSLPVLKTIKAFGYELMTPVQVCIFIYMCFNDNSAVAIEKEGAHY